MKSYGCGISENSLAMIAQATTTLRIGTALLVLPMREPVYLAKQITTIDQLSGGRSGRLKS